MRKLQIGLICLAVTPALTFAAADPALMAMVMPDAKVIAGAQVRQVANSPFGSWVLTHLQLDDPEFQKFMAATGFDPRRDLTELMIAANGSQNDPARWLVLGRGTFDSSRIRGAAVTMGGTVTTHKGVAMVSIPGKDKSAAATAVAFPDASTAVMGPPDMVEAALDRRQSHAPVAGGLAGKVRQLSSVNDFWFSTLVPLSEFAGSMPDSNIAGALKGNMLAAVQQASGGIKFGAEIVLSADIVTRTPQDASSLVDVVKFLAGLIQTNRKKDTTAEKVSTVLDSLKCSSQGNVMTMSLAIPEPMIEQMLQSMSGKGKAKKPAPETPPNK